MNRTALVLGAYPDRDQRRPRAQSPAGNIIPVTVDNFNRAETDLYFGNVVEEGGFGAFEHHRELAPIDKQLVVRATATRSTR